MLRQLIGLSLAFVVLSLIFWVLEELWPSIPKQPRWRRGFTTDLIYWFWTPIVTKTLSQILLILVLVPLLLGLGRPLDPHSVKMGFAPAVLLPLGVQVLLVLILGDFIGYWTHRAFHSPLLWRFHAIHHSSQDLDWLSSVRLHPINDGLSGLLQAIPFVVLGFSPQVIAAYLPFLLFFAIMLHANLSWSFRPFHRVIASPIFHRWHHTREEEALDKNFAGLFPLWDLLFGTFYMPKGKYPTQFGTHDQSIPQGFWKQIVYPFQ